MRSLRRGLSAFSFFVSVSVIQMACAGREGTEPVYVVDIFPIVERKDEAQYGEHQTKRFILENCEEFEPLMR